MTSSDTIQIDTKEGKKIFPFFKKQEETDCQKTLTTKVLKMALQHKYADIIANLPVEQLEELRKMLVLRPEFSQLTTAVQSGFQDIVALKVSLVEKEVLLSKLLESYLIKAGYLLPRTHTT
uniref:Uncharacterized protein n=2 Tax=Graphocephala atropunctata TaxID=36148 RepID=A0A1B6LBG5_9HEMI